MTRVLFDTGIFSVIDEASAIGVGWQLSFYTANTTTRIVTYTTPDGSTENTNPVLSDAEGRFPAIWIEQGQSIKWTLADADGAIIPIGPFDNYPIPASPPDIDAGLYDFLAGDEALPIASGGTGETSAVNAIAALGGLPLSGGELTGQITQDTAGAYLYNADSGMAQGAVFLIQDGDPDPAGWTQPGQWLLKWT